MHTDWLTCFLFSIQALQQKSFALNIHLEAWNWVKLFQSKSREKKWHWFQKVWTITELIRWKQQSCIRKKNWFVWYNHDSSSLNFSRRLDKELGWHLDKMDSRRQGRHRNEEKLMKIFFLSIIQAVWKTVLKNSAGSKVSRIEQLDLLMICGEAFIVKWIKTKEQIVTVSQKQERVNKKAVS